MPRFWTRAGVHSLIDIEDGATVYHQPNGPIVFSYPVPGCPAREISFAPGEHANAIWAELTGETPPEVVKAVRSADPITHLWMIHGRDGKAAIAWWSLSDMAMVRVCTFDKESADRAADHLSAVRGERHFPVCYEIVREDA